MCFIDVRFSIHYSESIEENMVDALRRFHKVLQERKLDVAPLSPTEREYFQEKVHQFQHERLVHLIVTMTVGLATLMLVVSTLQFPLIPLIFGDVILVTLFVVYLIHYRSLENGIQKTYELLDELQKH